MKQGSFIETIFLTENEQTLKTWHTFPRLISPMVGFVIQRSPYVLFVLFQADHCWIPQKNNFEPLLLHWCKSSFLYRVYVNTLCFRTRRDCDRLEWMRSGSDGMLGGGYYPKNYANKTRQFDEVTLTSNNMVELSVFWKMFLFTTSSTCF